MRFFKFMASSWGFLVLTVLFIGPKALYDVDKALGDDDQQGYAVVKNLWFNQGGYKSSMAGLIMTTSYHPPKMYIKLEVDDLWYPADVFSKNIKFCVGLEKGQILYVEYLKSGILKRPFVRLLVKLEKIEGLPPADG